MPIMLGAFATPICAPQECGGRRLQPSMESPREQITEILTRWNSSLSRSVVGVDFDGVFARRPGRVAAERENDDDDRQCEGENADRQRPLLILFRIDDVDLRRLRRRIA